MNISIIGCGYVGLVTGICLADKHGHNIYFVDNNKKIISNLSSGKLHIHERNLKEKLIKLKKKNKIFFSSNITDFVNYTQATIVSVGTPNNNKNKIDLNQIKDCSKQIGTILKDKKKFHAVIYKSTIPPGTINNICIPILQKYSKKEVNIDFGVGSNPEFLREGSAVYDFENPSRIIIGSQDNQTKKIVNDIYKKFQKKAKIINVDLQTSEMIKYFNNAFYSLLISFGNEFGNLCTKIDVDFMEIIDGFKHDNRLHKGASQEPEFIKYLYPGIGYGGSCFPKDIKALIEFSKKKNSQLEILKKTDAVNEMQPKIISNKILKILNSKNIKKVLVLGVTFKENSDDLRNSTSIKLINYLLKKNIKVSVFDPLIDKEKFNKIMFEKSKRSSIDLVDNLKIFKNFNFIIVNNRSNEYKRIILKLKNKKNIYLFDSRRYFIKDKFKNYNGAGI